jgi:hypothetical protein
MKLADIELDELVRALAAEQTAWIKAARDEGRRPTEPERVTLCMLSALRNALQRIGSR